MLNQRRQPPFAASHRQLSLPELAQEPHRRPKPHCDRRGDGQGSRGLGRIALTAARSHVSSEKDVERCQLRRDLGQRRVQVAGGHRPQEHRHRRGVGSAAGEHVRASRAGHAPRANNHRQCILFSGAQAIGRLQRGEFGIHLLPGHSQEVGVGGGVSDQEGGPADSGVAHVLIDVGQLEVQSIRLLRRHRCPVDDSEANDRCPGHHEHRQQKEQRCEARPIPCVVVQGRIH